MNHKETGRYSSCFRSSKTHILGKKTRFKITSRTTSVPSGVYKCARMGQCLHFKALELSMQSIPFQDPPRAGAAVWWNSPNCSSSEHRRGIIEEISVHFYYTPPTPGNYTPSKIPVYIRLLLYYCIGQLWIFQSDISVCKTKIEKHFLAFFLSFLSQ